MKNFLNAHCTSHRLLGLVLAASLALPLTSLAASVALATAPLATSTTSAVSPNLMLLMDDSGSMDWDHMPDDATDGGSAVSFSYGYYGLRSSQCNQVYYNPSLTYLPPVNADGTSYADATFTAALPNGYKASGGSNVAVNLNSSFKASLSLNPDSTGQSAYYYSYSGAQTTARQKNYNSTTNTFYNECHSASGATPGSAVFSKFRLATTETTTITVNSSTANATFTITVAGGVSTPVSSITLGGTTITSGSSTGSTNNTTEASNLVLKITQNGYSATYSGAVITVTGPATVGAAVVVNESTADTFTVSAITPVSVVSGITVGGTTITSGSAAIDSNTSTTATNIAAKINASGYSATASGNVVTITGPTSAANYTPALTYSGTMTYTTDVFPDTTAAKLTNFADWYSYYRTRMLMMKTSTGRAFKPIDNKFRVGFATLDNNNYDGTHSATADAVDIATFDATQKSAWYAKLYASTPGNSTSLRSFLSTAGQFYAHKLPGNQLNHLPVKDPIQYSCQQNFAIMSTDGFWNGNAGYQMDGSTAVGNQDGGAPRPQYDGGIANKTTTQVWQTQTQTIKNTSQILQVQAQTSHLQNSTTNLQSSALALLSSTADLQSTAYALLSSQADLQTLVYPLKSSTADLQSTAYALLSSQADLQTLVYPLKSSTANLQSTAYALLSSTSNLQVATGQLQQATSVDSGTTWTAWSNVISPATCTWKTSGSTTRTKCQYAAMSGWTTAAGTCTVVNQTISTNGTVWTGNKTSCQYTTPTAAAPVGSCTYNNRSGGSPYSVLTETICSYAATSPTVTTVTSCTPVAYSSGTANGIWANNAHTCAYNGTPVVVNNAGSCTYKNQSGGSPYSGPAVTCSYDLTATPVTAVATTCTPNQTTSTADGTSWSISGHACGYAAYTTPSPGACTYQNKSASSPYSGPAVTCSYAATSPTVTTVTSCTPVAYSSGTANGIWANNAHTCGYAAYTTPSPGACTYQNKSASSPYSGPAVTCSYATTSPTVANVSTCTPVAYSSGTANGIWANNAHTCGYSTPTSAVDVSTCTTVAQDTTSPYDMTASGGVATTCSWSATGWTNITSPCVLVPKDTTSPYDMTASSGVATLACQTVGTNACASGTTCATAKTGPTPVSLSSCTGGMSSCTSPFTGTSCVTTSCTTTAVFPRALVASCACTTAPSCTTTDTASPFKTTQCDIVSSTANNVICAPQAASAGNNYTTVTCTGASGGTSDNLADVAMYYYQTDLRDQALWNNCTGGGTGSDGTGAAGDVCANNVYISGDDNNTKQHMTTFTLGLGASGRMVFSPSYKSDASGDYVSVKNGAIADSTTTPPTCSWLANGSTCNWPIPGMDGSGNGYIENIDDLWHAAVDGRGAYFSATDPASLATGLSSALSSITARKGAAAAAATSTLNPVAGNNFAYVASYTTVKWTGNLEARSISTDTGVINEAATWCVENLTAGSCSAPSSLVVDSSGSSTTYSCVTPSSTAATCTSPAVFNSLTNECSLQLPVACNGTMPALVGAITDTRKIYTANSTGTSLINFDAAYAAANPTNFSAVHINTLSQWASLSATQKTAAAGANLVNFLRGQNGFEDRASNLVGVVDNRLYRYREAVMGDALESQPAYLGPPTFSYADPGYSDFKTAKSGRPGTVYIGANDGMMHAFAADTGIERWAYVPSVVIPNMWILADKNYDIKHANFVNGSPIMSDVCTAHCTDSATAVWRTILVGGLNGGGRGYYALDITDPTAPALLWEFTPTQEANVGYSFGNPVITQKVDGTWVVLVTSGYNNTSPGDGKGYLYVLNALTGAEIGTPIPTGVGDTTTPSGLAKISAWSNEAASNVAGYVYGGDLLGNVWRFDINTAGAPLLFATLKDPSGIPQPITTSPVLGQINGKRVIFVGTGKYLETLDLSNSQVESMYAIMDDDATATFANPRTHTTEPIMVNQTLTSTGSARTVSSNKVDFTIDPLTGKRIDQGWYVDFPDSGERVNIDSKLVLGTLLVPTIVPTTTVCSPGGYGWLNYFDYSTGGPVPPSGSTGVSTPPSAEASVKYDSTIVGINLIFIEGTPKVEVVTSTDPTPRIDTKVKILPATANFTGKRMLWRELIP